MTFTKSTGKYISGCQRYIIEMRGNKHILYKYDNRPGYNAYSNYLGSGTYDECVKEAEEDNELGPRYRRNKCVGTA